MSWKVRAERALGEHIAQNALLGGGSTAGSFQLTTASGKKFFCKHAQDSTPVFGEESTGLGAIHETGTIKTPRVVYSDDHLLLLEWIESEEPGRVFWPRLGKQLAEMHRRDHDHFGFAANNHIGATAQANPLISCHEINWTEFFVEHRLKAMLHHSALATDALLQARFATALNAILRELDRVEEPPSLVHGDLWNGNFLCGANQTPYLVDPVPYYGHREVDLAMSELFGGFSPEFYKAYQQEFPLAPGFEKRRPIYNLYHLMNHWILFGESYRTQTLHLLAKIGR